ncbi:MAG: hypothetical protein ABFD91_17545 [Anaerohalosphaeraceae bacterium]
MIFLLVFSAVGFVLSTLLHSLLLLDIFTPPQELNILINVCGAFAVYMAIFISKRTSSKTKLGESNKTIFRLCPPWIASLTGFLIIYAFASFLFLLFKKYYGGSIAIDGKDNSNQPIHIFSGHWMALYALAFSIVYSCKKYADTLKNSSCEKS